MITTRKHPRSPPSPIGPRNPYPSTPRPAPPPPTRPRISINPASIVALLKLFNEITTLEDLLGLYKDFHNIHPDPITSPSAEYQVFNQIQIAIKNVDRAYDANNEFRRDGDNETKVTVVEQAAEKLLVKLKDAPSSWDDRARWRKVFSQLRKVVGGLNDEVWQKELEGMKQALRETWM